MWFTMKGQNAKKGFLIKKYVRAWIFFWGSGSASIWIRANEIVAAARCGATLPGSEAAEKLS